MIDAVLFDLDGTLADTAPDLGYALNTLLMRYDRAQLPLQKIRPVASHGARGLLELGFGIKPNDPYFDELRTEFLDLYLKNICRETRLFDGMEDLLTQLENKKIKWGVVTNKPKRFTDPLIALLKLDARAACVVSGDSYARPKPYPDPLLGAAEEIAVEPGRIVYVGDDERDMQAARAAETHAVIANWGYMGNGNSPDQWPADASIDHPSDLLAYLGAQSAKIKA
ncbi:MAG: HAD-IA family hydrolase [Burkholderiales bacterium]